mgnify:CR=1 FL=1
MREYDCVYTVSWYQNVDKDNFILFSKKEKNLLKTLNLMLNLRRANSQKFV